MCRIILAIFLAAAVTIGNCSLEEIPSFLNTCRRSDPYLNECIKRSVDALKPYLTKGIPAFNIPPCEPLQVPKVEISQTAGPVSISSTYSNIRISGGSDFNLRSVKVAMDKNIIRLKLYIPRLSMISNYNMSGKILMVPITGHGQARGNYSDIDAITTIQGKRYPDPNTGKIHFEVVDLYCDFDVGHASIHLDNLFNGDETLADAMNLFLNDNWRAVTAEIKPAIEKTIAEMFKNFSNKIYSKYPLDVLLPP